MQITNRCFAVTGLGYASPWCVNAGFIVGEETTLIVDTGGNRLAAQSIHGYARIARQSNRLLVINTEKHFDHIGGNGFFRELGIDVWGHGEIARTAEEFEAEKAEFNDSIADRFRRDRKEADAFFYRTGVVAPNRRVEAEMQFDLGGLKIELLLTPGHTSTNISIWVPQEGVLFAGDCIVTEYYPNLEAGDCEDWRRWIESLDRIERLEPRFVVGGHGPVCGATEIPATIESIRSVLRESIASGLSPSCSYEETRR